jgi:hypothetical protein
VPTITPVENIIQFWNFLAKVAIFLRSNTQKLPQLDAEFMKVARTKWDSENFILSCPTSSQISPLVVIASPPM